MPIYSWMIIYSDESTEIVRAEDVIDALDKTEVDWYLMGVRAIIRLNQWFHD